MGNIIFNRVNFIFKTWKNKIVIKIYLNQYFKINYFITQEYKREFIRWKLGERLMLLFDAKIELKSDCDLN